MSTKPLNVRLDMAKAGEILTTRPRLNITMADGGKEVTLVELARGGGVAGSIDDALAAADDNVNVLC